MPERPAHRGKVLALVTGHLPRFPSTASAFDVEPWSKFVFGLDELWDGPSEVAGAREHTLRRGSSRPSFVSESRN